jgi:hypothetical protein
MKRQRTPKAGRQSSAKTFTLGWHALAKISEVEGIYMPEAMEREFQEYDRKGLSAEERHRLISRKYANVR